MAYRDRGILIIDDEPEIVASFRELLTSRGYEVLGLSDSREASTKLDSFQPDACLFDFRMPCHSGAGLLDLIKKKDPRIEVIFLRQRTKHLEQLVLAKTNALIGALTSLNDVYSATLDALSMALDFRDPSTSGHSRRVADLTSGAARNMGIRDSALVQIEHGALLHDIGKLKIPDSILWKPAKLDDEEWRTMRRHAEYGYEFLSNVEFLKGAAEIVYAHHERFDGTGYPRRIRGEQIPFGARVFMVVDTVDAMIYKRPYNNPVRFTEAAAEVRRCAGTQFDPCIVEPTLEYLSDHVPEQLR